MKINLKKKHFTFLFLIACFGICFMMFLAAGTYLKRSDEVDKADAIVVLMGSLPDRVLHAADLYHNNHAGQIIIVRENLRSYDALRQRGIKVSSDSNHAVDYLLELGVARDHIRLLEGNANSTKDEAQKILEYISANNDADTLILVTSSYHSRRAAYIFEKVLNESTQEIKIISSPSIYTNFNAENWWREKNSFLAVFSEYAKFLYFIINNPC